MKLRPEDVRALIAVLLLAFLAVVAVFLWFIDLLTQQRAFGVLIGAELVAFAMLVYIYSVPNYNEVKESWLLLGELTLGAILLLAIVVSL